MKSFRRGNGMYDKEGVCIGSYDSLPLDIKTSLGKDKTVAAQMDNGMLASIFAYLADKLPPEHMVGLSKICGASVPDEADGDKDGEMPEGASDSQLAVARKWLAMDHATRTRLTEQARVPLPKAADEEQSSKMFPHAGRLR